MTGKSRCELTCAETTPLAEEGLFRDWISRMPDFRRRKVAAIRSAEGQRLSLGVGILLVQALERRGVDGQRAEIVEGAYGRQELSDYPKIHFSLSHAGNRVLCAICDQPVGCDVERTDRGDERIPGRFFHEEERRALEEIPERKEWERCFAHIWTRKESYLKATGMGLHQPMKSFSSLSPGDGVWYDEKDLADGYAFSCCVLGEREPEFSWELVQF